MLPSPASLSFLHSVVSTFPLRGQRGPVSLFDERHSKITREVTKRDLERAPPSTDDFAFRMILILLGSDTHVEANLHQAPFLCPGFAIWLFIFWKRRYQGVKYFGPGLSCQHQYCERALICYLCEGVRRSESIHTSKSRHL